MTLYKQLYLLLGALFLLVFLGTFGIGLDSTRAYQARQLAAAAQETATSLGLSISTKLAARDTASVKSMVDAVFDRGYYRLIRVTDTAGRPVYERTQATVIERVPGWFIQAFPLETPVAEAAVMTGWTQAGMLQVASHPGYGYDELWRGARETLVWYLGGAALALLAGTWAIRRLLLPLRRVEQQAVAICNREYPVQKPLPWTRELRRVVQAMNRMAIHVGNMFEEQSALIKELRGAVYTDAVTGLDNRKRFEERMTHLLQAPDEFGEGTLLLLQLRDFKDYNDRRGYQAGDEFLRCAATILQSHADGAAGLLCRLSGADFAALLPTGDPGEAGQVARSILEGLHWLHAEGVAESEDIGHIGLAHCRSGMTLGAVLSLADLALRQAQRAGPNQYAYYADAANTDRRRVGLLGARQWREWLERQLEGDALVLHCQPVADLRHSGEWLHLEALLRARGEDGSLMAAGAFMPMADRLGLSPVLDRRAVELAEQFLQQSGQRHTPLAINLADGTINAPEFADWLATRLGHSGMGPRLIFEVSEYGVASHLEPVKALERLLRHQGSGLAIDHFGSRLTSFAYLRDVPIRYVKLDGSFTRAQSEDRENGIFLRAMVRLLHELEIRVIAESVETEAVADYLAELNFDGLQGYYIGHPADPMALAG